MNTDTKRHIDAARQVLVGVVPNPTSQIDQITTALIYKFMDDMDQASVKVGGEPAFFVGDLEKYAWTRIMDSRLGNQERMNLYAEALVKFSESKQLPELFRGIFKSAFLPYRSPETLGLFLKEIGYFDYSHPEELGNAYEYLLSIMSSQGDAGQFRTPRHIIDFMVDVVNPTKDDKVLDPACGTGGFLIKSFLHILEQHDGKNDPEKKEKPLTPDERKKMMGNFEGYDIDPGMVRIAQVNMYLHQFKNPKIFQYDSLSQDERWNDKFDVILANPPFMSPKGGITPHNKFSIQSSRSEVLFVDYIMNHLKPNGRAAIIVPEGVIFQSGIAYKQLRKNLVENGLYAVVSLPGGVFNPYSGVKTSILFIDKNLSKSKDIIFFKVTNDGYTLNTRRVLIEDEKYPSDLNWIRDSLSTEIGHILKNGGEIIESEWYQSFAKLDKIVLVKKEKLATSIDYNLSGDRYRVINDYVNTKWPMVNLGSVAEYMNGFPFKPSDWKQNGVPIIRIQNLTGSSENIHLTDKKQVPEKFIVNNGDLLISWSGTIGFYIWHGEKAFLNQHIFKVIPGKNIDKYYLYYLGDIISTEIRQKTHGNTMTHITKSIFNDIQIPLPPIDIQKEIVKEIDGYKKIIDGAKQIINSWKPNVRVDRNWTTYKLKDIITGAPKNGYSGKPVQYKTNVKVLTLSATSKGKLDISKYKYLDEIIDINSNLFCKKDDILLQRGNTIDLVGTAVLLENDLPEFIFPDLMIKIRANNEVVLPKFLEIMLQQEQAREYIKNNAVGSASQMPKINHSIVEQIPIQLPTLDTQIKIVESIMLEKRLVESNEQLILIYEKKIQEVVNEL